MPLLIPAPAEPRRVRVRRIVRDAAGNEALAEAELTVAPAE